MQYTKNVLDSEQNQDVQGDLYEYMLGHMQFAGRGGQFRTPRHIIRMMVQMVDPKPRERIGDLAGGTGGFPFGLQEEFAGVVARVESLRGRMGESERQVEGLFESLLAESFA